MKMLLTFVGSVALAGCVNGDPATPVESISLTHDQSEAQVEERIRYFTQAIPDLVIVDFEMNAYRTIACGRVALEGHEPHVFQSLDLEPDDDNRSVGMPLLSRRGLWDDPRNRRHSELLLKSCQERGLLKE